MEKIKEYMKEYKYEMGGGLFIIILYVCLKYYQSTRDTQDDNKKRTSKEMIQSSNNLSLNNQPQMPQMNELLKEMKKMNNLIIKMVQNTDKRPNYVDFRDKYFTKDIEKKHLLVDTKSMTHDSSITTSTSSYKLTFGKNYKVGDIVPKNEINFPDKFHNVIGFRLIKAVIPNTVYQVNETNKTFHFSYNDHNEVLIGRMVPSSYTLDELAIEFVRAMNAVASTTFEITGSDKTFRYTLSWSSGGTVKFYWEDTHNNSYKLVGGESTNTGELTSPHEFPNTVDHSLHFIDLVINEIPAIATKLGTNGKKVIDRIPLSGPSGTLTTYLTHPTELYSQNFFYPITLNQLRVQLYDDTTNNLYNNNNNDHHLEFEVTMLKNTKLLK